jgi:hypothetical protein
MHAYLSSTSLPACLSVDRLLTSPPTRACLSVTSEPTSRLRDPVCLSVANVPPARACLSICLYVCLSIVNEPACLPACLPVDRSSTSPPTRAYLSVTSEPTSRLRDPVCLSVANAPPARSCLSIRRLLISLLVACESLPVCLPVGHQRVCPTPIRAYLPTY